MHSKTYQKSETWESALACTDAENLPVTLYQLTSLSQLVTVLWEQQQCFDVTIAVQWNKQILPEYHSFLL